MQVVHTTLYFILVLQGFSILVKSVEGQKLLHWRYGFQVIG
jgi:hypothetical protein